MSGDVQAGVQANDAGGQRTDRLLLCGSRTWRDDDPIKAVLGLYLHGPEARPVVIHGCAKGADSLAGWYAEELSLEIEEYPADWDRYGKRAGYVRNQQMLDEGKPTVVWAFVDKPLAESKGTSMMVDIARKAGVPIYVVQSFAVASPGVSPGTGGAGNG